MGGARGGGIVEFLGVKSKAEGRADTRAEALAVTESKNTSVVDFSLHKSSVVEVGLGTDFKDNTSVSSLGIVKGLGTSFSITADTVVVTSSEGIATVKGVKSNGIFRSIVANSGSKARNATLSDVVSSLATQEETVTTDNSVGSKGGTPKDIEEGAGVET